MIGSRNDRPTSLFQAAVGCLLLLLLCAGVGCGTKPAEVSPQAESMRALAVAYGQYVTQHRGRPPKNEAALRKFVEANMATFEASFGVTSVDDLFTSPRDNEPYVVTYGKQAKIVAYEKNGLDGMRYIADDLGIVEEVDEATFAERVPNAE